MTMRPAAIALALTGSMFFMLVAALAQQPETGPGKQGSGTPQRSGETGTPGPRRQAELKFSSHLSCRACLASIAGTGLPVQGFDQRHAGNAKRREPLPATPEPRVDLSINPADEIKTTTCYMCACRCGIRVFLKDGKVRYIEGNRDHPVNKGVLCGKGSA